MENLTKSIAIDPIDAVRAVQRTKATASVRAPKEGRSDSTPRTWSGPSRRPRPLRQCERPRREGRVGRSDDFRQRQAREEPENTVEGREAAAAKSDNPIDAAVGTSV